MKEEKRGMEKDKKKKKWRRETLHSLVFRLDFNNGDNNNNNNNYDHYDYDNDEETEKR